MEYMGNIINIVEDVRNFESIDAQMDKLKRKLECLRSSKEGIQEELKYAGLLSLKKSRKVIENWLRNIGRIKNLYNETKI